MSAIFALPGLLGHAPPVPLGLGDPSPLREWVLRSLIDEAGRSGALESRILAIHADKRPVKPWEDPKYPVHQNAVGRDGPVAGAAGGRRLLERRVPRVRMGSGSAGIQRIRFRTAYVVGRRSLAGWLLHDAQAETVGFAPIHHLKLGRIHRARRGIYRVQHGQRVASAGTIGGPAPEWREHASPSPSTPRSTARSRRPTSPTCPGRGSACTTGRRSGAS